jgi:glutathione synthase/RimK-type ligase-like ATP-grasp enzyme
MPGVKTINDLSKKHLYGLDLDDLNKTLDKLFRKSHPEQETLSLIICFGKTNYEPFENLARQIFELFPVPILRVELRKVSHWIIESIRPEALNRLSESEEDLFATALDLFSRKIWRRPRSRKKYRYDLAILLNPNEKLPPSDSSAIKKFMTQGKKLGMDVDLIGPRDYIRVAEYDALFIRETTAIGNHTYRFAKKAESEGMVVIDDPVSIVRCTNKVYLADLLKSNKVPTPRTRILSRDRKQDLAEAADELGYPLVLKIPDGSFSRGVVKVTNEAELQTASAELFRRSALVLAQEFMYTDYDWRIGFLNNKPLFACQYFMSKGHWQIYQHSASGKTLSGKFRTIPVYEAPKGVLQVAAKAANLIGNGLYGVDVKQVGKEAKVIEVNDNPNIDGGVEDLYLGDELYRIIMEEFMRRLERKRTGL